jgi:inosose dehydratase
MTGIRIANAPCSWGVMMGFAAEAPFPPYQQVLDEMADAGYVGSELGDWGFMPDDAEVLAPELERRGLEMVGALVPGALADPASHREGVETALRTARLLAACADEGANGGPFVILADANGSDPDRTRYAGRIRPEHGLSDDGWENFIAGTNLVAQAVRDETGLRTVFHHHCAGFIETPAETIRLLEMTQPSLVGLCFDTGHWAYAGGDPVGGLRLFGERVWHVHFKDCHPQIAERASREKWDYFTAVRNGVFYGLGGGEVDFEALVAGLRERGYTGWIVVEDELPPGMGDPFERARLDREHLRAVGL